MILKKRFSAIALCVALLMSLVVIMPIKAQAVNPYMPLWEHIPDAEPHLFRDPDNPEVKRVYVYGSHDTRKTSYCGQDIPCWSAPEDDLTDWRYDGPCFQSFINNQYDTLYAPDVVEVKKRDEDGNDIYEYYLYPNNQASGRASMVAKSSRPDGPFEIINIDPNNPLRTVGPLGFDPGVVIDTDEDGYFKAAYAFWGFRNAYACELDPDTMYSVKPGTTQLSNFLPSVGYSGEDRQNLETTDFPLLVDQSEKGMVKFYEASSPRKIGNKWVLVYSGWAGTEYGVTYNNCNLKYIYSDNPLGPWKYGGVIVDGRGPVLDRDNNMTVTSSYGNTHGGIVESNDRWYVFFHRCINGHEYSRQAMMEPIYVEADTLPVADGGKVTITGYDPDTGKSKILTDKNDNIYPGAEVTSQGPELEGLNPYKYYSAGIACHVTPERGAPNVTSPTYVLATYDVFNDDAPIVNIRNASVVGYKYFNFVKSEGTCIDVYLTPKGYDFTIDIMIDTPWSAGTANAGTKIGELSVSKDDAQQKTKYSVSLPALDDVAGKRAIYFVYKSETDDAEVCQMNGLAFGTAEAEAAAPTVPKLYISVNGIALNLADITAANAANANGYADYFHYNYSYALASGTTAVPTVAAYTYDPSIAVSTTQASVGSSSAVVQFSRDGLSKIYTIRFTVDGSAAVFTEPGLLPPSNPIVKAIYTADPSAHVWPNEPDKLYVYPSHDQDPAVGCDLMDKYHVYSTTDMVNWVDEGEIVNSDEVDWGRSEGGFMWAPDAMYWNGQYYFFFPHPTGSGSAWGTTWEVGVATSKYPNKDFVVRGILEGGTTRPDSTSESNRRDGMIDPNIFIDDDGTPYLFTGGSQRCYYGELSDDLMSVKDELIRIPSSQVPSYHEGPWVFKREGMYYLVYPGASTTENGVRSDQMLYCMSDSVHGPWQYKGAFLGPVNTGDTSHCSVVEFKGRWFIFYHNAQISGGTGNIRFMAVDEVFFNEDGTIQKVVQTSTGPAPIEGAVTPARDKVVYEASSAVLSGNSVKLTDNAGWPAGQVISDIEQSGAISSATFNNVDGGAGGRATIAIRYAAAARRSVRLVVNGYDWGYINLLATSGVNSFDGEVEFTVTNMLPGSVNTVQLFGRSSGATNYAAGPLNIAQIASIPFNDGIDPNAVKITGITATSPLSACCAANVKFNITGQNLKGKTIRASVLGAPAVDVVGTESGASGVIYIPIDIMSTDTMKSMKVNTLYSLSVRVLEEKASITTPITVMPYSSKIWDIYTEDSDGLLSLQFFGDIHGSSNLNVSIGGKNLANGDFSIEPDNSVMTNVPISTITDNTSIVISKVKFPMFISYSFTFKLNGLNPEPPIPPWQVINITTNGPPTLNEEVENLIDNNVQTKWYTDHRPSNSNPLWVTWNYDNPVTVDSFKIGTANDVNGRDPRYWTISGSNDGINYEVFYSHSTNLTTSRRNVSTITLAESVTYKFYKLEITGTRTSGNGCQLSEFYLLGDFNQRGELY